MLTAFKSQPFNADIVTSYREFREKVLLPVLADLAQDPSTNALWVQKLKKLKEEVDAMELKVKIPNFL